LKLYDVYGRARSRKVTKYLIDWDKKSRSKLQFNVKQFLRNHWKNHIVYEEFPVYGTRLKVDIVNMTKKIAIEVQGAQHETFNKFFHDNSRAKYLASIKRDAKKAEWLERNDFVIMYIYRKDIPNLSLDFFVETYDHSIV
jgi:very-short-patch-repair endonuclease